MCDYGTIHASCGLGFPTAQIHVSRNRNSTSQRIAKWAVFMGLCECSEVIHSHLASCHSQIFSDLTLGIEISERTVSRLLRKLPRWPSQTWKTFLHNHVGQMVSMDFFIVPTITMKVLFVFMVLEHSRREVLHFNVTEHPSADWTSQQIVEAFANQNPPRYLLGDRDRIYGNEVRLRIASLQMEEVLTAPRSPWQNPYAERLIGSIRRDCLDHFVILNARHLKRTLSSYFAYYHGSRTHLGLDKQCPHARQVSSVGRIVKIPHLGGLHHRYERIAA